jgi:hypothetical protein
MRIRTGGPACQLFPAVGKYLPRKAPDDEFILICDPRDVALYRERCPNATCVGIGTGNRNRRKRLLTEHCLLRSYLDHAGVDVLLHTGVGVAPLLMPRHPRDVRAIGLPGSRGSETRMSRLGSSAEIR